MSRNTKGIIILLMVVGIGLFAAFFISEGRVRFEVEPAAAYNQTNALKINIRFELKDASRVQVKYWPANNDKVFHLSSLTDADTKHDVTLVGLTEQQNYHYQIVTASGKQSDVFRFTTKSIPKAMLKARWIDKPIDSISGYILTQRIRIKNREGFVYMLDFNGETVWYQKVPGLPKVSVWSEKNSVIVISGDAKHERSAGDRIYEYDINGNELLNLNLASADPPMEAHHEIRALNDGSLLTLIYDYREFEIYSKGKKNLQKVKGDAIVKLDRQGNILWKWSVFDVSNPAKSIFPVDSTGEWGHANTLAVDQDGNYLISFRDWNQIWKIDATNGSLIWTLGEKGNIDIPDEYLFSGQHAIHINPKGEYMMFDNGVKSKRSRILAFKIDETSMKLIGKLNILLPENLYSAKRGSAYYIEENKILVCAAESSGIGIVDGDGNVLGYAHTGIPDYYRAVYVQQLY